MCRLLNGWRNNYGVRSVRNEANDEMAFATVSEDKEETKKTGKRKRFHALDVRRSGTTQESVKKNCLPRHLRMDLIC